MTQATETTTRRRREPHQRPRSGPRPSRRPERAGHPGRAAQESVWRANATLGERAEIIWLAGQIQVCIDPGERETLIAQRQFLIDACLTAHGPRGSAQRLIHELGLKERTDTHHDQQHARLWQRTDAVSGATLDGAGSRTVATWLPGSAELVVLWASRPHLVVWRLDRELAHVVYFDGDVSVLVAHSASTYTALNANANAYYPTLWEPFEALQLPGVETCGQRRGRPRGRVTPRTPVRAPAAPPAPVPVPDLTARAAHVSYALLKAEQKEGDGMIAAWVWLFDTGARSVRASAAALREARKQGLATLTDGRWTPTALARSQREPLEQRYRRDHAL